MKYKRSPIMQARLADNRKRIMQATRVLIALGGFREVTIGAVAQRAGLSSGAIYRYFPSKSELCVQALMDAMDYEIGVLHRVVEKPGMSAAEQLRAAVRSFVSRALEGPHLAYAFIAEPFDPKLDAGRIVCRERLRKVFEEILDDGIRAGEFPDQDVEVASSCLVGAFTEALSRPMASGDEISGEELVQSITVFCCRAVLGAQSREVSGARRVQGINS